jgi:hypothetical protein
MSKCDGCFTRISLFHSQPSPTRVPLSREVRVFQRHYGEEMSNSESKLLTTPYRIQAIFALLIEGISFAVYLKRT